MLFDDIFYSPVSTDENGVCFELPGGHIYDIPWSRIKDRDALLGWLDHLAGKRWFTPEAHRHFIAHVRAHHGWPRVFP